MGWLRVGHHGDLVVKATIKRALWFIYRRIHPPYHFAHTHAQTDTRAQTHTHAQTHTRAQTHTVMDGNCVGTVLTDSS